MSEKIFNGEMANIPTDNSSLMSTSLITITIIGALGSFVLLYSKIFLEYVIFRYMFYQLDLHNDCVQFPWFSMWFSYHPYTKKGSSHIKPRDDAPIHQRTKIYGTSSPDDDNVIPDANVVVENITEIKKNIKIDFIPGHGLHLLYRNGEPLIIKFWASSDSSDKNNIRYKDNVVIYKPKHYFLDKIIKWFVPCNDNTNNINSIDEILTNLNIKKKDMTNQYVHTTDLENANSIFKDLLLDCFCIYKIITKEKTAIFTTRFDTWTFCSIKEKRDPKSVILHKGVWKDLCEDVSNFLKKKQWYKEMGIPHRRGYLLYGEPGNGKTTTISAIAGYFNMDIYIFKFDGTNLDELFSRVPPNSIILIEDIDSIFPNETKNDFEEKKGGSMIFSDGVSTCVGRPTIKMNTETSYSALLNSLDGVCSSESRIIFMTTNFREELPKSLIRPGRIDKKIYFGQTDEYQFNKFIRKFYPNEYSLDKSKKMWENIKNYKFGMASLQGYLLRNATLDDAIKSSYNFKDYIEE